MEIRRFGVGHRRPDGPPGTQGVSGSVIDSGPRATIAELAFVRGATVRPHSNPNLTWFLVIEGGGFVRTGDEQARVSAGDAVLWPAGEIHAAWTELSEMRAIVVDLGAADPATIAGLLEGGAREVGGRGGAAGVSTSTAGAARGHDGTATDPGTKADGKLVQDRASTYDPGHGEPV